MGESTGQSNFPLSYNYMEWRSPRNIISWRSALGNVVFVTPVAEVVAQKEFIRCGSASALLNLATSCPPTSSLHSTIAFAVMASISNDDPFLQAQTYVLQ